VWPFTDPEHHLPPWGPQSSDTDDSARAVRQHYPDAGIPQTNTRTGTAGSAFLSRGLSRPAKDTANDDSPEAFALGLS